MKKYIQLAFLLLFSFNVITYAQVLNSDKTITNLSGNGYYQKVDLNDDTPCGCDQKTQRTHDLSKGLRPNEVLNYSLHAYSFSFGNNINAVSKLFKAFENDSSIFKVSMKEWSEFMLLTTSQFDVASFEKAAKQAFGTFTPIKPEEFLKLKNTSSYNEYVKAQEESKIQQQANPIQQ